MPASDAINGYPLKEFVDFELYKKDFIKL